MMRQAWLAMFLTVLGTSAVAAAPALHVEDLRCEYLRDPLGIDEPQPWLSWTLKSDERGQRQIACQVLVASSPELLEGQQADLWDSGRMSSEETAHVLYGGKALPSRKACFWKVRAWDRHAAASDWSRPARWEMGLLRPDDWSAQWIGGDLKTDPAAAAESLSGATWILVSRAGRGPEAQDARRHALLPPPVRPAAGGECGLCLADALGRSPATP